MNTNKNSEAKAEDSQQGLDLKKYFLVVLRRWPVILLSLIITLFVAFVVNRYSKEVYKSQIILLIGDDKNGGGGMEGLMEAIGYYNPRLTFENELLKIKSKTMAEATLAKLDFEVGYEAHGRIKEREVYDEEIPFKLVLKPESSNISGKSFEISIDKDRWELLSEVEEKKIGGKILFSLGKTWNEVDGVYFQIIRNSAKGQDGTYKVHLFDKESLAGSYSSRIVAEPSSKGSAGVTVSLEGHNQEKINTYLNTLAATFIEADMENKSKSNLNTIRFIDEQLSVVTDSLAIVEDKREDFRSARQLADIGEAGKRIMENLEEISRQRAEQNIKLKYYDYLEEYVVKRKDYGDIIAPSLMGVEDPILVGLVQGLASLQQKRSELQLNVNEGNHFLSSIEAEIDNMRNSIKENLQSLIESNEIMTAELERRERALEAEIAQLPKTEREFLSIERKFLLNEGLYNFLLQKRAEAGIIQASLISSHEIVDPAVSLGVIKPKQVQNYMIALMLGLIFPITGILMYDMLNNRIRDPHELEHLSSVPVIGSVGHNNKETNLIVYKHPKGAVSEALRSIRTGLNYFGDYENKTILITSSISGEGKSFCAMNLASILALSGKKTVLVGLDMRKPKLFNDFGIDNTVGVVNYLVRQKTLEEVTHQTVFDNLSLISAGPTPPNPSELIMSATFAKMIAELKEKYEYVVLDSPPVGLVADGFEIMKHADLMLYVVRQNYTRKDMLDIINKAYESGTVKKAALLMNDVGVIKTAYGYGYGYGYGNGYGYGYGYYEEDVEKKSKNWFGSVVSKQ